MKTPPGIKTQAKDIQPGDKVLSDDGRILTVDKSSASTLFGGRGKWLLTYKGTDEFTYLQNTQWIWKQ